MRKYCLLLSTVAVFMSCSKTEPCYYTKEETKPIQFTLVDFVDADLDSLYITKYQTDAPSTIISNKGYKLIDKSFDQGRLQHAKLISGTDTIEMISYIVDHIEANQTAILNIQPANRTFQVSAEKSDEIEYVEVASGDCDLGRTFVTFLKSIKDENGNALELTYSDEYNMGASLLLVK